MRGSVRIAWKHDDYRSGCGLGETKMHVLCECTLYGEEREIWRGVVRDLKDGMNEYEIIKGHHVKSDEREKETMRYMRLMWNSWHRHETIRYCESE